MKMKTHYSQTCVTQVKAFLSGKFMTQRAHIKQLENLISDLMTHLRVIEQQEQIIPKRVEEKKSKL